MIKSYGDHAANERTFLAWVRTAIAIMAFGFLLERFDLFLQIAAVTLGASAPQFPGTRFGRDAGLGLLLLGVAITIVAAIRFLRIRKAIDSVDLHVISGVRIDVALAVLLALLGLALAFYLAHAIVSRT
jgi:putative membrane protein